MKIIIAVVEPGDPTHPGYNLDTPTGTVRPLPSFQIPRATSDEEQEVGFDGRPPDADMP